MGSLLNRKPRRPQRYKRRRLLLPEVERYDLAAMLMAEYRRSPRYRQLIDEHRQKWVYSRESYDPRAEQRYWATADAMICRRLQLTKDGRPAPWAREFVRADIRYGPLDPDRGEQRAVKSDTERIAFEPGGDVNFSSYELALKVRVSPSGAEVRLVSERMEATRSGPGPTREVPIAGVWHINASPMLSFQQWDELEKAAVARAREAVARLQAGFQARYSKYDDGSGKEQQDRPSLFHNPATLRKTPRDIRLLAGFLFDGSPVGPAAYERLRGLAERLGIDLPPRASRLRKS